VSHGPFDVLFCLMRLPPVSALFPYTTLFRSLCPRDRSLAGVAVPDPFDPRMRRGDRRLRMDPTHRADRGRRRIRARSARAAVARSEEHTSELQSLAYLVCRLLLEKKKYLHQL